MSPRLDESLLATQPPAPTPENDRGLVDVTEQTIADRDVVANARKHIASLHDEGTEK